MQIGNSKKVGIEILISDKINFKTKAIKKDKEGHHIVIKKSMSEENITLVSIYVPNMCKKQAGRPGWLELGEQGRKW